MVGGMRRDDARGMMQEGLFKKDDARGLCKKDDARGLCKKDDARGMIHEG